MEIFITSFITLLVIIDPLGNAAVFAGLTKNMDHKQSITIALKATAFACLILIFFGFIGKIILVHMGISISAFQISGGLLLAYTAFQMILGGHEKTQEKIKNPDDSIIIFPMAIPLMAGPGCITAFILLLNTAISQNISTFWVVSAMVAVEFITLFLLIISSWLKQFLGTGFLSIFARVMGIFLAAMAVQYVISGVLAF